MVSEESTDALRERCTALERELDSLRRAQQARLALANDVHRSLLPRPIRDERLRVDVRYVPIEEVGGDYCQVRFSDRDTCYVTMCDVMGHGVGAAMLAARISSEVRYGILYRREPRDIAASLDRFVKQFFAHTELFLTFIAARLDLERMELTYSGAGHPSPILVGPGGRKTRCLESQNPLIGLDLPKSTVQQDTVALCPRDRLHVFTDGLFEVVDAGGRQLGIPGLARLVEATADCDLFDAADQILGGVQRYQFAPNPDDQTLIVAEMP